VSRGRHAKSASRRTANLTALAGLVLAGFGGAGFMMAVAGGGAVYRAGPITRLGMPSGRAAALLKPGADQRVPRPIAVIIPAIGVRARVIRLGLTGGRILAVPASASVAGWYTGSPRPGAIGSAVIVGHVDSKSGPGVFFRLRSLRPRDRIYIRRSDGTLAIFAVTAVREYPKMHFPAELVYGPVPVAALRLITCGGFFDAAIGHYLSNVIAFAVQVREPHVRTHTPRYRHDRTRSRLATEWQNARSAQSAGPAPLG
jgi:hypothetical protein